MDAKGPASISYYFIVASCIAQFGVPVLLTIFNYVFFTYTSDTTDGVILDPQAWSLAIFFLPAIFAGGSLWAVVSNMNSHGWTVSMPACLTVLGMVGLVLGPVYGSVRWNACDPLTDAYCVGHNYTTLKLISVLGWIWLFVAFATLVALYFHGLATKRAARLNNKRMKNSVRSSETSGFAPL